MNSALPLAVAFCDSKGYGETLITYSVQGGVAEMMWGGIYWVVIIVWVCGKGYCSIYGVSYPPWEERGFVVNWNWLVVDRTYVWCQFMSSALNVVVKVLAFEWIQGAFNDLLLLLRFCLGDIYSLTDIKNMHKQGKKQT